MKFNSISVNLNTKCNMACTYCFVDKEPVSMSHSTKFSVLDYIKQHCSKRVHFFGTEPLIDFELIKWFILRLGTQYTYGITTNGTLMTEKIAKWLKKYNVGVLLSCDGVKMAHDLNRTFSNGDGSFKTVVRNWDILVREGIIPSIAVTVTSNNIAFLLQTVEFLLERPQKFIHLNVDTTSKYKITDYWEFYRKWTKLAKWYTNYNRQGHKGKIRNFINAKKISKLPRENRIRFTCGAAQNSIGIHVDGTIRGCHRKIMSCGNVIDGIDLDIRNGYKKWRFIECRSCSAWPCSTCYANNLIEMGNEFVLGDTWCKIQIMKSKVYREVFKW